MGPRPAHRTPTPAVLADAARTGTELAAVAEADPDRMAVATPTTTTSFGELEARVNRLCRHLRGQGVGPGDSIALLAANRVEWVETFFAALRLGLRLTPVNWHLEADDVAYIVADCGARALVADTRFATVAADAAAAPNLDVRLALGPIAGFDDYESALAAHDGSLVDGACLGTTMIYTSGTTGRPKGVAVPPQNPDDRAAAVVGGITALFGFEPDAGDLMLGTAPLYHSGPSRICNEWPLCAGVGVVLMDRWDAEETLALVERHGITHAFMVPTMFHRLLALPDEVRGRYDVSSLRFILHGAAPTTVQSKQAMMDWFGPILHEMFASTEGFGSWITPHEWLAHPGSVGRVDPERLRILDDEGEVAPADEEGTVYLRSLGDAGFRYHNDDTKTAAAHRGDWFTVGDRGRVDSDSYLYLTGRSAEVIIVGGVNLYPARIDEAVLDHPAVVDVAVVGVPDDEYGEAVKAVVVTAAGQVGDEALAASILDHCRRVLGAQQSPRSVDFVEALPRSEAGKLYRQRVRDRYWPT